MPKNKPHKGLLKRVKITGKGKVKWKRSGASHLNSHMSGSQIMGRRKKRVALAGDIGRLTKMLHRPLTAGDGR